MNEMVGTKWGALSEEKQQFFSVNTQILQIAAGQQLDATSETNGGLQVVLGLAIKPYTIQAHLFQKEHGPNGQRHPLSDPLIEKQFGTKAVFFFEIADDDIIEDGSQYSWQW